MLSLQPPGEAVLEVTASLEPNFFVNLEAVSYFLLPGLEYWL